MARNHRSIVLFSLLFIFFALSVTGCNRPTVASNSVTPAPRNPSTEQAGVKEATPEEIKAFLADPQVPDGIKMAISRPQLTNAARTQIMQQYRQGKHTGP